MSLPQIDNMTRAVELLNAVTSGEVEVVDLIDWIQSKSTADAKLSSYGEDVRAALIPYFLNYLREQTQSVLQSCGQGSSGNGATTTPVSKPFTARAASADQRQRTTGSAIARASPSLRGRLFGDGAATSDGVIEPLMNSSQDTLNGSDAGIKKDERRNGNDWANCSPAVSSDGVSRRLNERMQEKRNRMNFNDRLNPNAMNNSESNFFQPPNNQQNNRSNQQNVRPNQQKHSNRSNTSKRVQLFSPPPAPATYNEDVSDFPALKQASITSPLAVSVTPKRRIRPTPVNLSKEEFTPNRSEDEAVLNSEDPLPVRRKAELNSSKNGVKTSDNDIGGGVSASFGRSRSVGGFGVVFPGATPTEQICANSNSPSPTTINHSNDFPPMPESTSAPSPIASRSKKASASAPAMTSHSTQPFSSPITSRRIQLAPSPITTCPNQPAPFPVASRTNQPAHTPISTRSSQISPIASSPNQPAPSPITTRPSQPAPSLTISRPNQPAPSPIASRPTQPAPSPNAKTSRSEKPKKRVALTLLSPAVPVENVRTLSLTEKENLLPVRGSNDSKASPSSFSMSKDSQSSSLLCNSNCSSLLTSCSCSSLLTSDASSASTIAAESSDLCASPVKSSRFFVPTSTSFTTPVKPKFFNNESPDMPTDSSTPVKPSPPANHDAISVTKVTKIRQLDSFANLYKALLLENVVTNLAVEIYFLMDLITILKTTKELDPVSEEDTSDDQKSVFLSPHNVVYFAMKTLSQLKDIVFMFDKSLLRMLAENSRVESFLPKFSAYLSDCLKRDHFEQENSFIDQSSHCIDLTPGVPFQPEVDDRSNFPCDKSFHAFKKIRDSFYELLREWQDSHASAGWTMGDAMGSKIVGLVRSSHQHLSTRVHFSRLFKAQLVLMCAVNKSPSTALNGGDTEEEVAFLSKMKKSNPEKHSRLLERFTKQAIHLGPSPPPSFSGIHEFFHDFILIADCCSFNQHLSDVFKLEILDLSNSLVDVDEEKDFESEANVSNANPGLKSEMVERYTDVYQKLNVMAKFFGFVTFFAYLSNVKLPPAIQADFFQLRAHSGLDNTLSLISKQLEVSFQAGKLILDIPWIVAFMAQIDHISLAFPAAKEVISRLSALQRELRFANDRIQLPVNNRLLIILKIGWLFDTLQHLDGDLLQNISGPSPAIEFSGLDCVPVVQEKLFQSSFSFLNEIKLKFCEFSAGSNKRQGGGAANLRKITPLCMSSSSKDASFKAAPNLKENAERSLHQSIRSGFFSLHPASLKKSAEFVAERISSKSIKRLKNFAKTSLLRNSKGGLKEKLSAGANGLISSQNHANWIRQEAIDSVEKLQAEHKLCTRDFCTVEIQALLPSLLSPEMDERVVAFAVTIAVQMAEEKVANWIATYLDYKFFEKELTSEWDKAGKAVSMAALNPAPEAKEVVVAAPVRENLVEKNQTFPSPSKVLIRLKEVFQALILNNPQDGDRTEEAAIRECLDEAFEMISYRDDIHSMVLKNVAKTSCELVLFYSSRHEVSLPSQSVISESLLRLWCLPEMKGIVLTNLESKGAFPHYESNCASLTKQLTE